MVNSNPAVKDLADQITSSENNKDVEKSLSGLKDSVDSLSEVIKKRGVKTVQNFNNDEEESAPFLKRFRAMSKGFFNPFTVTDILEIQLNSKQGEISADKLKTIELGPNDTAPDIETKELKEPTLQENKPKVEKKNKTKDPELSNKLLVSISQMLTELRENAIEKQLLSEAIKIRSILEKGNSQVLPSENSVPIEQELSQGISSVPDIQGRIEPYLEEENQKSNTHPQQIHVNTANQSIPPVHGEVIIPDHREEDKAKDRELLAQAIADKLAAILGGIGGNSPIDLLGKGTGAKLGEAALGAFGAGRVGPLIKGGTALLGGSILNNIIGEGMGSLGLGTSESQHDQIVDDMRKKHEEEKSLDILKNSNILSNDDIAPKPSPMSQENKKIQLTPKENQNAGSVLQNIFKKNEDLKSQESQSSTQQMLQPIISNQTTNNTSQTLMPAPPVPNQNTNSYLQWQKSKVNY